MRLVGFMDQDVKWIGRVEGERVHALAPADAFYRDPAANSRREPVKDFALGEITLRHPAWAGARVICIGLNYRAHVAEGIFEEPDYPAIFGRWTHSLIEDGGAIPALEERLDWEAELAVVIGRPMAAVSDAEGLAGVFGYAAFNDVTARTYQRHTHQWTTGKNMDRSGVLGPIVTVDEAGSPIEGLKIESRLNGTVMQSSNTSNQIFPVGRVISYLSEIMTLMPGDIIATGTPEGVGYARKPPIFMKPGDVIEVEIETIGTISNPIVSADKRSI